MSKDQLIDEILRRVMAKIAEYEGKCSCSSNTSSPATSSSSSSCGCACGSNKDIHIEKRVLSERDVIDACTSGILTVYYSKRTIVTDLAKDYAKAHKMTLVRE